MYRKFLQQVVGEKLSISENGLESLRLLVNDLLHNHTITAEIEPASVQVVGCNSHTTLSCGGYSDFNLFADTQKGSVAIIPIIGLMTKYATWYSYGMDLVAYIVRQAQESENISGIILYMNTPGGITSAVFALEEEIRKVTKPIVTFIDSTMASLGVYIGVLTNKIYAINRMAEVGSIGVMAEIRDYTEMEEKYGIKTITILPPESAWKNRPVREALEGKDELLITESLSPWAVNFQNIVKDNRPDLDLSVDGIIGGRMFYAYDAEKNGLIDGIKSLDEVIAEVQQMNETRKAMLNL